VAGYHQHFAVTKAVNKTREALVVAPKGLEEVQDVTIIEMDHELTGMVRKNRTVD
jgi:hypothetical protein